MAVDTRAARALRDSEVVAALRSPKRLKTETLAGLVVALALIPEAISFSIIAGQLLGITYGAGILIREATRGGLGREDIFFIGTFLMICHSIVEDVLLFVLFGANYWIIIVCRAIACICFVLLWRFGGWKHFGNIAMR